LAHLDQIGIGQIIPSGHITPRLTMVQGNARQGIAALNGVKAGFACIFCPGHLGGKTHR
jgi:hypothetical protein